MVMLLTFAPKDEDPLTKDGVAMEMVDSFHYLAL